MIKHFLKYALCLMAIMGLSNTRCVVGQDLENVVLRYIASSASDQTNENSQADFLIARLKIESELQQNLLELSDRNLSDLTAQLRSLTSTRESILEEKLGGLEIDRKTLQSLIANAHFELQRLEWEISIQPPTETKQGDPLEVKYLKVQIDGIQKSLNQANQVVEFAKQSVDRALALQKMATISNEEVLGAKAKLAEKQAEQNKLTNELELLTLKIEEVVSSPAIETAKRLAAATARKKVIDEQLAKYAIIRRVLPELETIDTQISAIQSRMLTAQQQVSDYQSKNEKTKALSALLDSANAKKSKGSTNEVKPAGDTPK